MIRAICKGRLNPLPEGRGSEGSLRAGDFYEHY
jgi:hypothetical protein